MSSSEPGSTGKTRPLERVQDEFAERVESRLVDLLAEIQAARILAQKAADSDAAGNDRSGR